MNAYRQNCNRRNRGRLEKLWLGAIGCFFQMACVTDAVNVRDNFRVLPLQNGTSQPVQYSNTQPVLLFDDGALTPDEQQHLIAGLHQYQQQIYKASPDALQVQVNSCRIIIHVGKVDTQYNAVCDAQLSFADHPLALTSARAQRQTRTRGLPASALKEKKNRNPWMEIEHTRRVLRISAEKAIEELLFPSQEKSKHYYFQPAAVQEALDNNDEGLLRAVMAKQSLRDDVEDDALLIQLAQHPNPQLAVDAARTLALRCQTRNKAFLLELENQQEAIQVWVKRGLACLQAREKRVMPLREKALAPVRD